MRGPLVFMHDRVPGNPGLVTDIYGRKIMARHKIDPAVSRKCYAVAEKRLKDLHADQFATLLDEAYAEEGVESPRKRRERLAAEAAQAATARRIARESKKVEKIERLKAELAALEGDPLF